jgi:hypothetical protein
MNYWENQMSRNTITLSLTGDVPLAEFAKAMGHFSALVDALTDNIGRTTDIEWEISKLEAGSATAVIISRSPFEDAIEKVVRAYEIIGTAIKDNKPIPFPEPIAKEAKAITGLLNGKIKTVEFITDEIISSIDRPLDFEDQLQRAYSFGTVSGTVETLSKRGRIRFILYDFLFDRAVNCYLIAGQEHLMLDAWDKRVRVAGQVYRDPITGRPMDVRDINYVQILDDTQIDFMSLAGIIPWKAGDEYPEETIRRIRDAEYPTNLLG